MTDNGHKKRIDEIKAETEEIRRQIMKLEFQHKKDIVEANREAAKADKRFNERQDNMQKHLDYITRLAGVTYEELDLLDEKLQKTGRYLTLPRERSTLS